MVHNGIPFDVAFTMEEAECVAYCIIFAGFHGNKFNWDAFEFEKREGG